MNDDGPLDGGQDDQRTFLLAGLAVSGVILVTGVAFFAVVLGRGVTEETPTVADTSPTPQVQGTPGTARLRGPVDLRSGPGHQVAIITRLAATEPIRVVGRSPDGEWLAIGPVGRPETIGWVPVDAVEGVDLAALPTLADPRQPAATGTADPDLTPDLPDLVVERAYSQDNRLVVRIANVGAGDANATLLVSVDGDTPIALDVRPGEPLRAGDYLEAEVPGVFVQLRAPIHVRVLSDPPLDEEDAENNAWDGIIGPDRSNDVEILGAAIDGPGGPLAVALRNNSPIPVTATFTVTVREALPSTTLLGRQTITATIESNGFLEMRFEEIRSVELDAIAIRLSADGIDDSNLANNQYPR
jgi:hypothetical protein